MGFLEDLRAAQTAPRPTADVDVLLGGKVYKITLTKMGGLEWAQCIDRAPMRPDVPLDRGIGYDLRALTLLAVPVCSVVHGPDGEQVEFQVSPPEQKKNRVNEWAEFLRALDGESFNSLSNALFGLNVSVPEAEVEAARKALDALQASSS